jgi:hypothetical protein
MQLAKQMNKAYENLLENPYIFFYSAVTDAKPTLCLLAERQSSSCFNFIVTKSIE